LKDEGDAVVGWSWTRFGQSEMAPGYGITTGLRTSVKGTGKDLVIATLQATRAIFDFEDKVWLETWASNERAIGVYLKTGAVLLGAKGFEQDSNEKTTRVVRPTVYPDRYSNKLQGVHYVPDVRLFFGYPSL
jgi:hypothetical protein